MPIHNDTTYSIYRIVCFVTGNVYVGQTKNFRKRKGEHLFGLKNNRHPNTHLQRSFNKYGQSSFYFETIETGIPQSDVSNREIYWIACFDSYRNGFNMSEGGDKVADCSKPCTWNGFTYTSITEAAIANGIKPSTLSARMKYGYTSDAEMPGKGGNPIGKSCSWNGVNYPSLSAAAKANGVAGYVMAQRLRKGYSSDADMKPYRKSVEWNGTTYPSIAAAARANGISVGAMCIRIQQGYTCDDDMIITSQ